MNQASYVYILASAPRGTLYIGATTKLVERVWQQKCKLVPGFTEKYSVSMLVWFEIHNDVLAAATRERQLKKWRRKWKIELIMSANPRWLDLYDDLTP